MTSLNTEHRPPKSILRHILVNIVKTVSVNLRENPESPAFFADFTLPASLCPASLIGVNAANSAPKSQKSVLPRCFPNPNKNRTSGERSGHTQARLATSLFRQDWRQNNSSHINKCHYNTHHASISITLPCRVVRLHNSRKCHNSPHSKEGSKEIKQPHYK